MAKYHFNRETGRANICRAVHKCPLGADTPHFDSKDEAKAYILNDAKQNNDSFTTLKKKSENSSVKVGEFDGYLNRENYRIPEENFSKFERSVERANKKLEKYGIAGRFEYESVEKFSEKNEEGGRSAEKFYEVKLNAPNFAYNGYNFKAVALQEVNGIVVKAPRGVELSGWRPDGMKCEHCGQNRSRSKSYLIETPDGELKQIGSTCVEAYMGVKPEGLSALEYNPSDFEDEVEGDEVRLSRNKYRSTDEMLAIALAVSNGGRDYVSTQGDWSQSTAGRVYEYMNSSTRKMDEVEIKQRNEITARVDSLLASGEVDRLKKKLQKLDGNNDYVKNIKVLTSGDWVNAQNSNLLVSSVSIIGREERAERRAKEALERERLEEKRIADAPKGHYLNVDDKIPKGSKFTVTEVRKYESYNPYTRNNEVKLAVNMLSEDNKNIQWFTTPPRDGGGELGTYSIGQELEVSSGRVKSHGDYKGVDQTVIGNVRLMK